jgi:hypothetical protein
MVVVVVRATSNATSLGRRDQSAGTRAHDARDCRALRAISGTAPRQVTVVVESVHCAVDARGIGNAVRISRPAVTIGLTGVAQAAAESIAVESTSRPSENAVMLKGTPIEGVAAPLRELVTVNVSTVPAMLIIPESPRTMRYVINALVETESTRESPSADITASVRTS